MRDDVQAESTDDYFRKSITVAFLDYMLNKMKTRFTDKKIITRQNCFGATVGSIYY